MLNSLRKTQNLRSRPIHLRRYSDNPAFHNLFDRFSAPGTLIHNTPHAGSLNEASRFPVNRRPNIQRARAVSVNDAGLLQRYGPDYFRHLPDINHLEPDLPEQSPSRATGLTLEVPPPGFLAPPSGHTPDTTTSSPASSISPTRLTPIKPGRGTHARSESEVGSFRFESPLIFVDDESGQPSPLNLGPGYDPLPAGDATRDPLMRGSDSERTFACGSGTWTKFRYWPYGYLPPPQVLYAKLFPTLQGFSEKAHVEKLMALMAVPSVLLLTITLPVVEDSGGNKDADITPPPALDNTPLLVEIDSEGETNGNVNIINGGSQVDPEQDSKTLEQGWNRWLLIVQCICAPLFVTMIFSGGKPLHPPTPSLLRSSTKTPHSQQNSPPSSNQSSTPS